VIRGAGLRPLFLVGDDERSRAGCAACGSLAPELGAVGLVVKPEVQAGWMACDAWRRT